MSNETRPRGQEEKDKDKDEDKEQDDEHDEEENKAGAAGSGAAEAMGVTQHACRTWCLVFARINHLCDKRLHASCRDSFLARDSMSDQDYEVLMSRERVLLNAARRDGCSLPPVTAPVFYKAPD